MSPFSSLGRLLQSWPDSDSFKFGSAVRTANIDIQMAA